MSDNSWVTSLDGLPPAGTECEVLNPGVDNPEWERCKILFMGKSVCVYESESYVVRVGHHDLYNVRFRPIKTEREIAIDELVELIFTYYEHPKGAESYIGIASCLYDAGYRKNES